MNKTCIESAVCTTGHSHTTYTRCLFIYYYFLCPATIQHSKYTIIVYRWIVKFVINMPFSSIQCFGMPSRHKTVIEYQLSYLIVSKRLRTARTMHNIPSTNLNFIWCGLRIALTPMSHFKFESCRKCVCV